MMRTKGALAGWLTAVVASYAFCWPAAHGYGLIGQDTYRYFMPLHAFMHEELQAGRLPLWNPYLGFGVDTVAESQSGAFYSSAPALGGLAGGFRGHARCTVALLGGFVLAAAQIVPTLEFLPRSSRGGEWSPILGEGGLELWFLPQVAFPWHFTTRSEPGVHAARD